VSDFAWYTSILLDLAVMRGSKHGQEVADQLIEKVEQDLIRTPPEGPNLYRIYAYLYLLSIARNNKDFEKKYKKLMKNNLTIFPFGIAR
jgi:hypothetical protein